jgi:aspartate-semialdehyde dehydrogenase
MLRVLEERDFPISDLLPLASARSAGKEVMFRGHPIRVEELTPESFAGRSIALFSAGGSISTEFAPHATAAGAWVIDNTSAFRMDPKVPLVVPEVNAHHLDESQSKIIANPNCSTIQMVVALEPLRREAGLRRIVVSTYQAIGGAGNRALEEYGKQAKAFAEGRDLGPAELFPHTIFGECLPQIGDFADDGYTLEELKMIYETRKIFDLPQLAVTATAVRVPVAVGHSESINIETESPLSIARARELLAAAPGVELVDQPEAGKYPLARHCEDKDPVYVGRLRVDHSVKNGLNLWVVADNLRKGAALNAVQIAEVLHQKGRVE